MVISDATSSGRRVKLLHAIGCACALVPTLATGQVSGTWTGLGNTSDFSDSYNWSSFPNAPVTAASFTGQHYSQTSVTLSNDTILERLSNSGSFAMGIGGTASLFLIGPAQLHSESRPLGSPYNYRWRDVISRPIGGASGLTKAGPGAVHLNAFNSYSGTTRVLEGWLVAYGFALGNGENKLELDRGGLILPGGVLDREIVVGAGGGSVYFGAGSNSWLNTVSGDGPISFVTGGTASGGTVEFTGAATQTGATSIRMTGARLVSNGSSHGRFTSTPQIDVSGYFTVGDGFTKPPSDCINDNAILSLRGARVSMFETVSQPEVINVLRLASGRSRSSGTFTASTLERLPGTTLHIESSQQPSILLPPMLVGDGSLASPTVGVLPYIAHSAPSIPPGPVTYDAGRIRRVGPTEQLTLAELQSPNSPDVNLRLSGEVVQSPISVRSLQCTTLRQSSATITINGGGIYCSTNISNAIHFGDFEGFVHTQGGPVRFLAPISGNAGLTISGQAELSVASPYVGPTHVNGVLEMIGSVWNDTPSPIGAGRDPLFLHSDFVGAPILRFTGVSLAQPVVFQRPIIVSGESVTPARILAGAGTTTASVSLTGPIEVGGVVNVGDTSSNRQIIISGDVSGPGTLRIVGPGTITLSGNNSFSGDTEIGGRLRIGSNTAFGTGSIWIDAGSTMEAIDEARVITNPLTMIGSVGLGIAGTHELQFTSTVVATSGAVFSLMSTAPVSFAGGLLAGTVTTSGTGTLQLPWYRGTGVDAQSARITFLAGQNSMSSRAGTLNIGTTAVIDLNDHTLILDRGGGTITGGEAGVLGFLSSGRLISTVAANTPGTGIGYALVADALGTQTGDPPAMYAGQLVREHDLIIRYTLLGDANLDGNVNINDFARLAANFNVSGAFWSDGNFNHDDATDIADFALMAANFNQSLPLSRSAVPEPVAVLVLGSILPAIRARFRRKELRSRNARREE